ncbi:MAG: hypothetical protein AAF560_07780 [Acidobacteriota bacterium]
MKISSPQADTVSQTLRSSALLLLLPLLLAAPPVDALGHALKTAGGDALLVSADGKAFVQRAGGQKVELPLPKGSRVSALHTARPTEGEAAWLAAAVARVDGQPQLRLIEGKGDAASVQPAPQVAPVKQLMQPTFVAAAERVHALVWLAGDAHHKMAVQAARRLADGSWDATQTLSPPGKGTQIALTTAVLADGSWLVAWAAFDGTDDEILWSRYSAEGWSKPQPVAAGNAVPDITPSLYPTADGALIAWSRYDGDAYRVNVARFDGTAWSAPTVAGPPGSTSAVFSSVDQPILVYRRPAEGAWAAMALDATGKVRHDAALVSAKSRRPAVASVSAEAIAFEWPSVERREVSAPLPWTAR